MCGGKIHACYGRAGGLIGVRNTGDMRLRLPDLGLTGDLARQQIHCATDRTVRRRQVFVLPRRIPLFPTQEAHLATSSIDKLPAIRLRPHNIATAWPIATARKHVCANSRTALSGNPRARLNAGVWLDGRGITVNSVLSATNLSLRMRHRRAHNTLPRIHIRHRYSVATWHGVERNARAGGERLLWLKPWVPR